MITYVRYQCSVCRRTKDLLKDNVHVVPNYCTITKGCSGHLFPIGEFPNQIPTPPVAGIEDWYPRGISKNQQKTEIVEDDEILLASSSSGAFVVALFLTEEEKNNIGSALLMKFLQRRIEDISYVQFNFKTSQENQAVIAGRDSNGVNLRFDQEAINDNRIFVRVNGVTRFPGTQPDELVFTPNTITFNSPLPLGAVVTVTVFQEKDTIERTITLQRNDAYVESNLSAWSNVVYVESGDADFSDNSRRRWWLYTAAGSQLKPLVAGSRLRLIQISAGSYVFSQTELENSIRLLLAKPPYISADRYYNFYVSCADLRSSFALTVTTTSSMSKSLSVAKSVIKEIYPPMLTLLSSRPPESSIGSSFINVEAEIISSSSADVSNYKELESSKIIGPI